jgi:transposase
MKTIENTTSEATPTTENREHLLVQEIELLKIQNEALEAKVKFYEEQFRLSQQKKYGSSSDLAHPEQLAFNEVEKLSAQPSEEPEVEEILVKRRTGRSKTRKTYADLPIEEVYYNLAEEDKVCPVCENTLHEMKTEVRKELKVIPAQVKVVHHIRQVYACRNCDDAYTETEKAGSIVKAPMPKPVLPGSMVSPSLLAFIIENKYNKALPLYRQEEGFVNFGIDISRQNMASWVMQGANRWLKLIYRRLHHHLLNEEIIHADESTFRVLDEKTGNCYMWLYASAATGNHPIALYEYQPGRNQKYPKEFLRGFSGFLQTDGYGGYNDVEGVIRVGCMAHARRKFTDALKALPKEADVSRTKVSEGLSYIVRLYRLEKKYKDLKLESAERFEARLKEAQPVLEDFRLWLGEQNVKALPKGKLGEAVKYCINQWDLLVAYLQDGRIAIDNNLAERAIKNFVIGRKNFLFAKSPKGATASAMCYSIVRTAKSNSLVPYEYLKYLFEQLPNVDCENPDVLDALLPWSESLPAEIRLSKSAEDK